MNNITIFGIELSIDPVIGKIGPFEIRWYGLILAMGLVCAIVYCLRRADKFGLSSDRLMDCALVSVPVGVLGARLYYMFFYGMPIGQFFQFTNGGLAIYGGIIFGFLAGYITCRIRKLDILSVFDIASLGFLIGQAIGRWGNFTNQEAYGTITGSSWWGMTSTRIQYEENLLPGQLVHPCFLYESVWCIIGFLLLHNISKKFYKFKGQIFFMYLCWYGIGRVIIEGLRTDSLYIPGTGIRVSQLLSGLLVLASAAAIVFMYRRAKQKLTQPEYVSVFGDINEDDLPLDEPPHEDEIKNETAELTEADNQIEEDTE